MILVCQSACTPPTGQNKYRRLSQAGFQASDLGLKRLAPRLMAQPTLTAQLVQDTLQTCRAFLDLAHGLFFSERYASSNLGADHVPDFHHPSGHRCQFICRWLGLSGPELFADVSTQLRGLLKDHVLPIMSSIIINVPG